MKVLVRTFYYLAYCLSGNKKNVSVEKQNKTISKDNYPLF